MKKIAIVLFALCAVSALAYTVSVGTTVKALVAPARVSSAAAYATNTVYATGALVSHKGLYYMCLTAGTASGLVVNATTDRAATNGTATFIMCPQKPREFIYVSNQGTNSAFLKAGGNPAAGDGIEVAPSASVSWDSAVPNGGLLSISENGDTTLSVTGW